MKSASRKTTSVLQSAPGSSRTKRSSAAAMLESVFACKWSARLLSQLRGGPERPGALVRSFDGLTTKVFNDCARRLLRFGLIERLQYAEVPPRVEYRLSGRGQRFVAIIDAVEELQRELVSESAQHDGPAHSSLFFGRTDRSEG